MVRCLSSGLHGADTVAQSVCVACGELRCVECGPHGLSIRADFAVAQSERMHLVFACPFAHACNEHTEEERQHCAVGHTGLLCAVCEADFGMGHIGCVPCSATNSSPVAAAGLLAMFCALVGAVYLWCHRSARTEQTQHDQNDLAVGLVTNPLNLDSSTSSTERRRSASSGMSTAASVKQKSTDLYMLMRIVYQPTRIVIGYLQVVTQIGPVLDLEWPPMIQTLLDTLKPYAIDLQWIVQLDCLSGGALDFYATWVVRVFVIPAVMLSCVGLQYCYEQRRLGHHTAAGYAKANSFVIVFLCYPGVCNQVSKTSP
eukprot:SAG22_NODE_420_length_10739_cov_7.090320_10_plen_314_part_00